LSLALRFSHGGHLLRLKVSGTLGVGGRLLRLGRHGFDFFLRDRFPIRNGRTGIATAGASGQKAGCNR
jgi:hypothetical protein